MLGLVHRNMMRADRICMGVWFFTKIEMHGTLLRYLIALDMVFLHWFHAGI